MIENMTDEKLSELLETEIKSFKVESDGKFLGTHIFINGKDFRGAVSRINLLPDRVEFIFMMHDSKTGKVILDEKQDAQTSTIVLKANKSKFEFVK